MIQAIRLYFVGRDYLEVETPNRIPAPTPECHIDAIPSESWFLHTSPELCMKRLLATGYPCIFQICKCYRHGERGNLHLPEFTLLEWYRAGIDYLQLMDECEDMIRQVSSYLGFGSVIPYGDDEIHLTHPWERISVKTAFERYAPCSLDESMARDCFEQTLVDHVEPHLGRTQPTFLYDYPLSMGALAREKPGNPAVVERFELYMAGVELANAFSELTDEQEQRRRFQTDEDLRRRAGKFPYPSPEPFLQALASMPPAAGIALGLDRLAMILTGAVIIDDVVAFPPELS
jgi:elongation factor P--(R)-beta-lysine ligase